MENELVVQHTCTYCYSHQLKGRCRMHAYMCTHIHLMNLSGSDAQDVSLSGRRARAATLPGPLFLYFA